MSRLRVRYLLLIFGLLAPILPPAPVAASTTYSLDDLGIPFGVGANGQGPTATGLNNLGQVIADAVAPSQGVANYHGFVWTYGTISDLTRYAPQGQLGTNVAAVRINNLGTVLGDYTDYCSNGGPCTTGAFLVDRAGTVTLIDQSSLYVASAVNDSNPAVRSRSTNSRRSRRSRQAVTMPWPSWGKGRTQLARSTSPPVTRVRPYPSPSNSTRPPRFEPAGRFRPGA